jgi:hypothetical protein
MERHVSTSHRWEKAAEGYSLFPFRGGWCLRERSTQQQVVRHGEGVRLRLMQLSYQLRREGRSLADVRDEELEVNG